MALLAIRHSLIVRGIFPLAGLKIVDSRHLINEKFEFYHIQMGATHIEHTI